MKVISIANQKGGVGKTSAVANIGYELSRHYKVLLLDMDRQRDLTKSLKLEKDGLPTDYRGKPTILDVLQGKKQLINAKVKLADNLYIVPGNKNIDHFKGKTGQLNLERSLANKKMAKFDYILIDHPPGSNEAAIAAMSVTDYVLIVTEAETLSIDNLEELITSLDAIKLNLNGKLKVLGLVANNVDMRRNLTKKLLKELGLSYSDFFFSQYISTNTAIPLAMERQIPVRLLEYRSIVVSQYQDVIREMLERMEG